MPVLVALLTALASVGGLAVQSASASPRTATVTIGGQVATPATYTAADLAGQPQTTLPDERGGHHATDLTGVPLDGLVTAAGPQTPDVKNAVLRVSLTVAGSHQRVAVALGELVSSFGNHPALLVTRGSVRHPRIDLVFPGDHGYARTVHGVSQVTVAVSDPAPPADQPAGSVAVRTGSGQVVLSAEQLAALPATTLDVTFASGTGQQTHTETGPTLGAVLRAARLRPGPTTVVSALATDAYVATVTPAEATSGRRPLLLALVQDGLPLDQPRLVVDGDVAGGRYVSGVVALDVTGAAPRGCRR